MVVFLSEFFRIHTELTGHLNLRMREVVSSAGIDPHLECVADPFLFDFFCHIVPWIAVYHDQLFATLNGRVKG